MSRKHSLLCGCSNDGTTVCPDHARDLFYLIMKDGDQKRWWNEEENGWGTRAAATRYPPLDAHRMRRFRMVDGVGVPGGRLVGPCDPQEE